MYLCIRIKTKRRWETLRIIFYLYNIYIREYIKSQFLRNWLFYFNSISISFNAAINRQLPLADMEDEVVEDEEMEDGIIN